LTVAPSPIVVIDAMNVIGAGANGWWRDRPGAQRRLHGRLADLMRGGRGSEGRGSEGGGSGGHRSEGRKTDVLVVYEGAPLADLAEGRHDGVEVRWARRRGRDAADDRIVEEVAARAGEGTLITVVTSDRGLRERVSALGAAVCGPSGLERALRP